MADVQEEPGGHRRRRKLSPLVIRQLPLQLRNNNTKKKRKWKSYFPTLFLQFHLTAQTDVWYLTPPHPHSQRQLVYLDESHHTHTHSFHLKPISPAQYFTPDLFYTILDDNFKEEGVTELFKKRLDIDRILGAVRYFAKTKRGGRANPICQDLDMSVALTLNIEWILDGRLLDLSSHLNDGMVPTCKTIIMQLPERMEIDEDHCLDDDCVICYEPLRKKKILCMPCSHMFHGDCITTWLDKSHYCPICRYDMPTTATQV